MIALTLHQPWATLIALGAKRYETRSWEPNYRGPLAIHAGKTLDREICAREPFREVLCDAGYADLDALPSGALIALAILGDAVPTEQVRYDVEHGLTTLPVQPARNELAFGDYSEGRFAWPLSHVAPMPAPIPCRGYQKLWTTPAGLELPPLPDSATVRLR